MSPAAGPEVVQRLASLSWALRSRLGSRARRGVRYVVDPLLGRWLGSVRSGSDPASVALTIDDGPDGRVSPRLLDLLAEREVRASWFLLTERAEQHPDLVSRMLDEGHEVALHGLDHRRVSTMPALEVAGYLAMARERLEQVTRTPVTRYRPPYGSQSLTSFRAARDLGLQVVVWSADAQDWIDRDASSVARDASEATTPGGILLLHERIEPDPLRGSPVTTFDRVEMFRDVCDRFAARSLQLTSVDELALRGQLRRTVWIRP